MTEPVGGRDEHSPYIALELRDGSPAARGSPSITLSVSPPAASWTWDGRTLEVRTGRLGLPVLYVCLKGDRLLVSPSILELLRQGAPAEPDWEALSVFLRWGNFVGEDTAFRSIRALPPNAVGRWEAGTWTIAGGIRHVRPGMPDRETALDAYVELFDQGLRRLIPDEAFCTVPLSGGRDSRHIFLGLHSAGFLPDLAVTARPSDAHIPTETPVAERLAKAVGVRHLVVPAPADRLGAERRKNHVTGFASQQHGWYWAVVDAVARSVPSDQPTLVFDGLGGDVLSAGLFATPEAVADFEAGRLDDLATRLLFGRVVDNPEPWGWFRREYRENLDGGRAVQRLKAELEKHADAPNPLVSFLFYNRTRRGVGGPFCDMWRGVAEPRFPFLDPDLFDHLMGLPPELTLDHRFHTDAIRRAYPEFADMPYTSKSEGGGHDSTVHRAHAIEVARRTGLGAGIPWIRTTWAAPRLLRCVLSPGYSRNIRWLGPFLTYLDDLTTVVDG